MSARSDTQRGIVRLGGGYDAAREGAIFESVVEAQIVGRLALRAGASYLGPRGEARPGFALKVDALRQENHGLDLAIAAGYEGHGFNTVPALTVLAAAGRDFGTTALYANAAYAQGLELDERYGDVRLGGLQRVTRNFRVGFDSRLRVDLERDSDEPAGEPDWELLAGPLASLSLGRFVLSAGPGVSAIKFRSGGASKIGVVGNVGLGAAF